MGHVGWVWPNVPEALSKKFGALWFAVQEYVAIWVGEKKSKEKISVLLKIVLANTLSPTAKHSRVAGIFILPIHQGYAQA